MAELRAIESPGRLGHYLVIGGQHPMDKAIELRDAIELVMEARKELTNVTALWLKVDRIVNYLNSQLAPEITGWA
jgi:hypothetical protein